MAKKFIRRIMPDHRQIREHRQLRFFGTLLHDPNLWHLNRRSASGAFAIGIFLAFIPMPFQMIPAAAAAILLRVNLPLSVALVWISNPLTMPALYYFTYRVGTWLLGVPPQTEEGLSFDFSWEWFSTSIGAIWQPLYLGSLLTAILLSSMAYFAVRGLWQLHLVQHYKTRKRLRRLREQERRERQQR